MNMLKKKKLFMLILLLAFSGAIVKGEEFYSLQIASIPMEEKDRVLALADSFARKGYFIYYYKTYVKEDWYVRVRLGLFSSLKEADYWLEKIKKDQIGSLKDYTPLVVPAYVYVSTFGKGNEEMKVVTTPSSIWLLKYGRGFRLFFFKDFYEETLVDKNRAEILPGGEEALFTFQGKNYRLNLKAY